MKSFGGKAQRVVAKKENIECFLGIVLLAFIFSSCLPATLFIKDVSAQTPYSTTGLILAYDVNFHIFYNVKVNDLVLIAVNPDGSGSYYTEVYDAQMSEVAWSGSRSGGHSYNFVAAKAGNYIIKIWTSGFGFNYSLLSSHQLSAGNPLQATPYTSASAILSSSIVFKSMYGVAAGDLVLVSVSSDKFMYFSTEVYSPNQTKLFSSGSTPSVGYHAYNFMASSAGNYLIRIITGSSNYFNYTVKSSHNLIAPDATPTPTPAITPTPMPTPTAASTPTPSPAPTLTPTPTPTPSSTPTPTQTPTATPTPPPSQTPTPTPTPMPTPTPAPTPTPTATPTPKPTTNPSPTPTPTPQSFFENFESYALGSFPTSGGWEMVYSGAGSSNQVVTGDFYVSGSKSLQLWGSSSWACAVQKQISSNSQKIGYEISIRISAVGTGGPQHYDCFGFYNEAAASWGRYYAAVRFNHDSMNISAEGSATLGTWTPGVWYKVKVVLDRTANTYSVWIDGQQKGTGIETSTEDTDQINAFGIWAGHPGVKEYYDDVSVFEGESDAPSHSPSPSSSPNGSSSPSPNPTGTSSASPTPTSEGSPNSNNLPLIGGIAAAVALSASGVGLVVYKNRKSKLPAEPPPPLPLQSTNHIFISHVEEDADVALEIANGLENAGYKTWYYERDNVPGFSYLLQTKQAIEQSQAIVLLISPHSMGSNQITKEVIRGHESGKSFVPVLRGIKHVDFQRRQPEWQEALGAASSIEIRKQNIATLMPRIIEGLVRLGVKKEDQAAENR